MLMISFKNDGSAEVRQEPRQAAGGRSWAFILSDAFGAVVLRCDDALAEVEDVDSLLAPPSDGLWYWEGRLRCVDVGPDRETDEIAVGAYTRATVADLQTSETPAPPAPRKPVAGWAQEVGSMGRVYVLDLAGVGRLFATRTSWWQSNPLGERGDAPTLEAAQLAAEDWAAENARATLAVLGER